MTALRAPNRRRSASTGRESRRGRARPLSPTRSSVVSPTQRWFGPSASKRAGEQIGRDRLVVVAHRGQRYRRRTRASRPCSCISRMTRLRLTCSPSAASSVVDARAAVGRAARARTTREPAPRAVGPRERRADSGASAPGVVPGPRHAERLAGHRATGTSAFSAVDERELHALSFAKKAAAFFRMSRSMPQLAHLLAQPRQLRALLGRQPRLALAAVGASLLHPVPITEASHRGPGATCETALPSSRTRRTAPALNSSVKLRRGRFFASAAIRPSYPPFIWRLRDWIKPIPVEPGMEEILVHAVEDAGESLQRFSCRKQQDQAIEQRLRGGTGPDPGGPR